MINRDHDKYIFNHIGFLLLDIFSLALAFIVSYLLKFGDLGFIKSDAWMPLYFITLLLNIVICTFSNPYDNILHRPYYEEIISALLITFYNFLASVIIFYVFKIGILFSRQMILTMYGLYFLLSLILKTILKKLILSNKIHFYNSKKIKLLVIARKDNIDTVIHNVKASDIDTYEITALPLADFNADDLAAFADDKGIEEVLIEFEPSELSTDIYEKLIKNGIGIHFGIEQLIGFKSEDYDIHNVGVNKVLTVGMYSFTSGQIVYQAVKRAIDIVISLIGTIILIPVAVLIKSVYLISGDRAPIIYKQSRIGKNGSEIKIFKFRTMVPDADKMLSELLNDEKYRNEWNANQKLVNDPRITKIGRVLRKTSIDELPQLLNVLLGDMSLVGPRPLVRGELEIHNGLKLYQQVKPGITGWWACNGRSNIDYYERLELEYHYVRNISAYLDLLCIFRTIVLVLKREGAE